VAESTYPSPTHNSRAVDDTEYERLAHPQAGDGVVGSPDDVEGVTATGAGMNVTVNANLRVLVRGVMYDSGTTGATKTISANASGLTRIDRVVARLTRATRAVTVEVVTGTPGSGAPALTQDGGTTSGVYEIPLAYVTVPSGDTAITADQVTWEGYYLGEQLVICTDDTRPQHAKGRRIYETNTQQSYTSNGTTWLSDGAFVCTSSTRPSHQAGLLIYETDTGYLQLSTGAAWVPVREDTGWLVGTIASGWTGGGGTIRYRRKNGTVYCVFNLIRSATLASGTYSTMFTLPAGYRPGISWFDTADCVGAVVGRVEVNGSTGAVSYRNDEALAVTARVSGSFSYPV
jgi:hypothetical protein